MYHVGVATQRRPLRFVPRLQESCIQEGQKVSPKLRKHGCTVMDCDPAGASISRGWGDTNRHAFVQAVGWPKGFFVARPAAGVVSHRGPRFYCAKGQRRRSNLISYSLRSSRIWGLTSRILDIVVNATVRRSLGLLSVHSKTVQHMKVQPTS
jgi:hypothetical protein